jgi:hypothetical protein
MRRISNSFSAEELKAMIFVMRSAMAGNIPDTVFRRPEWASAMKKIQAMHDKAQMRVVPNAAA